MKNNILNKGILFALLADAIWAFAIIMPKFLQGFSATEIIIGRYFVYGILSLFIISVGVKIKLTKNILLKALIYGFCGNLGYFLFLVLAVQNADIIIVSLIVGMMPVTMVIYGNLRYKEFKFKKILPSVLLAFLGLIIVNLFNISQSKTPLNTNIEGIIYAITALFLWTWYGVSNANFLKKHPEISPTLWSALSGLGTLVLLPFFGLFSYFIDSGAINLIHFLNFKFWFICIVLGIMCSHFAAVLWNRASSIIPTSIAGELIVGETAFELLYAYLYEQRLPHLFEAVGIILIIGALLWSGKCVSTEKVSHISN